MVTGPKTRPLAVKIKEGDIHKERWNLDEPKYATALPECPPHITGEARREWSRITKELFAVGTLATVDRAALSAYCSAWAKWVKTENELALIEKEYGTLMSLVSFTKFGTVTQNPLITVINRQLEIMHKFLIEFGMTPASRTRIKAEPKNKKQDPMEELLNTPLRRN